LRTSNFDPISIDIFNRQLKIAVLLIILVFAVLALRLWFLQIVNGTAYRARSENNRIRLRNIPPYRGMILDRNGEILVDNRPSYNLYVIPEEVRDRERLLENLGRFAGLDQKAAGEILDKAPMTYSFRPVCLKRDMSRDELAMVESRRFNLPGVMIKVESRRHYIWGSLASHLIGSLGQISEKQLKDRRYRRNKPGDLIGISGVEYKWQAFLNGTPGGEQVEVDAVGRKIREIARNDPVQGKTVCLTIDRTLQAVAEKALAGKKGAIVALAPMNGELLALASSPSFDPNLFANGIDRSAWDKIVSSRDCPLQNRALCGQYPPGSVFKIVVALAGLEEGVIDPEEEIACNGVYTLGNQRYRCWKKHGHGKIKLHRALVESCDVYFYEIGKRLGVDKIARYAKRSGLGKMTGLDIGKEMKGLIPTRDWKLKRRGVPWQEGETISVAIGQSFVLTTPIQMAVLISTVFNGGDIYRPQAISWAGRSEKEKKYSFRPEVVRSVDIKAEYMELVKKALVGVVNEPHGTGSMARLKNITVAGKTGTAQVVALKKGACPDREAEPPTRFRDHAWFVAVAPAENPRIALSIIIEHGGHGGSAAAPIAGEMIKAYLGD